MTHNGPRQFRKSMSLSGTRTFVGFGFGAIQAGLFLYEAFRSGAFGRLVVAEVVPEVIAAVRRNGGHYTLNIALPDRIERTEIGPVELLNPNEPADREILIQVVAGAQELGTAVPSVKFFTCADPGSLHRILALGLRLKAAHGGPPSIIYSAENHNHAAEILSEQVSSEWSSSERQAVSSRVRFLNTVVGKMSGVLSDPAEISSAGLAPVTPGAQRAFLVEAFNRILITRIDFQDPFQRGIAVFEEKSDLLPFEEAKLYGHNATHALAAYMGGMCGAATIADLRQRPGMIRFLRKAFVDESGGALTRKYAGLDPLFSPAGYAAYADDLLVRMTNPFLRDLVERVGRDPQRKLGWDDRLVGTMRVALAQNIDPKRYALGAAAAVGRLAPQAFEQPDTPLNGILQPLWEAARPAASEQQHVLASIAAARTRLLAWRTAGCPDPDVFFKD
jgi:mannitol-1-phosphate 5-dehydrogenase